MKTKLNPKTDFFVKCESPFIRVFLLEYAISKGFQVLDDENDKILFPHIGWDGTEHGNLVTCYHRNSTDESSYYREVSFAEFIHFLDTYEKPLTIAGHNVVFGKDHIKVGCTTVMKDTIKEVLKRLEK